MAWRGADGRRRAARPRSRAGALSGDGCLGAPLPRLGADRDGAAGAGGGMTAAAIHAALVQPFENLAFMRAALVACLALALSNGVVGTLLVLRRMSLDGDVLGHAVMPGAAVGFLC